MATPSRKVIDISHHNDVSSWDDVVSAGIVGVIHKATEGQTYVDPMYLKRCAPAMRVGLVWGAYHFAHGGESIQGQCDNFLNVTGVDSDMLYALDWEDNPSGPTMTASEARQFIELLEARIGPNRCVIYSGNTCKEALGSADNAFFGARRLWLAQYGTSPACQNSWDDYWLWQYSDGNVGPGPQGCPGVTGDVDTNSWSGTDAELRAQWSGAGAPAPAPEVATVEITVTGDVQIIVNGQVVPVG